jgi:pimeloyl-ACP methyl ester carboxylesterase
VQIPPPTSYARRVDVSIAYQEFGEGPAVVMLPTAPSHLDLMGIDPGYTQVLRRLGGFARTVIFDPRGVGLSDPLDHVPTVEEGADDLEAVMDAARVECGVLLAMGTACPAAAMFAARAPERVEGLVLFAPWAVGIAVVEDTSLATTSAWTKRWSGGRTRSSITGARGGQSNSSRARSRRIA